MNDDDLNTTLTRELRDRAEAVHGSPLGLADVTGRARSIRRRRTTASVVGVAAAVAVIVPTAALAGHHDGSRNEPAPSTQSTTTGTPEPPAPGVLDVSDLPTGAAPAIAYAEGNVIHRPNGSSVDVGHPVDEFVTLADGTIVYASPTPGGGDGVRVWPDRHPGGRPYPATHGLAVNAAHTLVAWVSPTGYVTVWEEPVYGNAIDLGKVADASDVRIASIQGDDCMQTYPNSVCEVDVNTTSPSGDRQPWAVTPDGASPLTDGSFLTVADQSASGLTIGLDKVTDSGSCSKLLGGGDFQGFETCKHTLVSFSPDESRILADPAYHDGIGNGVIAMYDVQGKVLFERHATEQAQSFYPEAQWEDDTHVLAPVFQDGKWAIVRFASDGSMEYAVPPVAGEDTSVQYVLATGGAVPGR
jgi:hypothetical protein